MDLLHKELRERIERRLGEVIDDRLGSPGLGEFRSIVRQYVLAPGGKRIRPQLTLWTFQNAGGDAANLNAAIDAACAWELFHAFLLVHDDIIDASPDRRGKPALHVSLASLDSNSPIFGQNLGIVAGDLLFSTALCLLHDLEIDAETHRQLLRNFSGVACTTGFGQALDICVSHQALGAVDQETLLREYRQKTAAYTFEGPMLSGAILAGLDKPARQAIGRFALAIGQAYQLHNDLLDLSKPTYIGSDLVQGKRTITLLQRRATIAPNERNAFDARLDRITRGDVEAMRLAETLRGEMLVGEAARASREVIDSLLSEAEAATRERVLPAELSSAMAAMLEAMRQRYFAAPGVYTSA